MKLPILGIIIIVLLQLGFTTFNALDRPMGSLYFVNSLTTETNPIAGLPDDVVIETGFYDNVRPRFRNVKHGYVVSSAVNLRKSKRPVEPTVVFTNTVIKIPAAKPDEAMLQFIAMHKTSNAAVIKYPQPMRPVAESDNFSTQTDNSSEKRSFVSKSASVLKKPYDWIKALGSKLK